MSGLVSGTRRVSIDEEKNALVVKKMFQLSFNL